MKKLFLTIVMGLLLFSGCKSTIEPAVPKIGLSIIEHDDTNYTKNIELNYKIEDENITMKLKAFKAVVDKMFYFKTEAKKKDVVIRAYERQIEDR